MLDAVVDEFVGSRDDNCAHGFASGADRDRDEDVSLELARDPLAGKSFAQDGREGRIVGEDVGPSHLATEPIDDGYDLTGLRLEPLRKRVDIVVGGVLDDLFADGGERCRIALYRTGEGIVLVTAVDEGEWHFQDYQYRGNDD
jgi:hypothetical protein